jgi:hypothetical protein
MNWLCGDLYQCDRASQQLPDILQAALTGRISRVSIQNVSKSLFLAPPRVSAIGSTAAGWLLFSPHELHCMVT